MHADHSPGRDGFTLIELSIVLIILSVMLGGVLSVLTQEMRRSKQAELKIKLEAIESAMIAFRKASNRLPCPGSSTLAFENANFGAEANVPGTCTGGAVAATFNDTAGGMFSVAGTVPVKALNLPDDYAFDPWGGRFLYIVDRRITAAAAFNTYPITDPNIGTLTIRDEAGNNRTTRGLVAIISHGPNGHGAYQREPVRKSLGSTNAAELTNCHCDAAAAATAYASTFFIHPNTSAGGLNSFDDEGVYYTRVQFPSAADILSESH